jgi:hypothetical protein
MRKFIKDLPKNSNLVGLKVKTITGVIGYFFSSTNDVIFLNDHADGQMNSEKRLYPQVLSIPEKVLEWEVIEDNRVHCNCHTLTDLKYILNE